jgi:hypothetical protein
MKPSRTTRLLSDEKLVKNFFRPKGPAETRTEMETGMTPNRSRL